MTVLLPFYMFAQESNCDLVYQFGSIYEDEGRSIKADNEGNLYLLGTFYDSLTIGDTNLVSLGQSDVFLAKFDASGIFSWARTIGGSNSEDAQQITIDNQGNILICGGFRSATVYLADTMLSSCGCAPYTFLAKYSDSGELIWARNLLGISEVRCNDVAVDKNNDVIITGFYISGIYLENDTIPGSDFPNMYVVKYNQDGQILWSRCYSSPQGESGQSICFDSLNQTYITGYFSSKLNLDDFQLHGGGGKDIFLISMNDSGDVLWISSTGSMGDDEPFSMEVTANGSLAIAGYITDTLNFSGDMLVSAGEQDNFLALYSTHGTKLWARRSGGYSEDFAFDLTCSPTGDIYCTGRFISQADFGDTVLSTNLFSDVWVARYSESGQLVWAQSAGGNKNDCGYGICWLNEKVYTTGMYSDTAYFCSSEYIVNGVSDVFVAAFDADMILSLPEIESDMAEVSVFPNPTHGNVTVYTKLPEWEVDYTIEVLNTHGQIIESGLYLAESGPIRLHISKPGLYFIRLYGSEYQYVKKIVVL